MTARALPVFYGTLISAQGRCTISAQEPTKQEEKSLGKIIGDSVGEVLGTFVNLIKAPRTLWGINISYLLEGLAYFGVLTILGKYMSEDVGMSDIHAGWVYSIFTGGITFAMLLLGGVSDKIGVRKALLIALGMMVIGRSLLGASGTFFEHGQGAGSPMFFTVLGGLFFVVIGYGMYQPAAYAGVKLFTNKKTAAIGFAMLYALMNLGAFFSGIISPPVRQATSMTGVYWVYVVITILAFLSVLGILTARVVIKAKKKVKEDNENLDAQEGKAKEEKAADGKDDEEKEVSEKAEKKPQKPLLEPAVIIFFILVAGGAVGFFYNMINAPEDELSASMNTHGGALPGLIEEDEADWNDTLESHLAALRVEKADLEKDETLDSARLDLTAVRVAGAAVSADLAMAEELAALTPSKEIPELGKDAAAKLRNILRSHAVTTMAASYGLVLQGEVDTAVVDSLRIKMKDIDEDSIPMDAERVGEISRMASLEPTKMLEALKGSIENTSIDVRESLDEANAKPLIIGLNAEKTFIDGVLEGCPEGLGSIGKAVLMEKLLGDSQTALEQAGLMATTTSEPGFLDRMTQSLTEFLMDLTGAKEAQHAAATFTSIRLGFAAQTAGSMGAKLPEAVPQKTGHAVKSWLVSYGVFIIPAFIFLVLLVRRLLTLRPEHPFHDKRFTFFIFVLIPVQTLFAHNWLTLPYYIDRAFSGTAVGNNFEFFSNLNPILIFVLTPTIAALTTRAQPYKMMIAGTLVMALPTFFLALPASPAMLITYIVLMTIGEAMWQPRFLQLVAEIAPEGKTGAYMGIGQLPWFMTKLVTGMYSGYFVSTYVPQVGPQNPQIMWLIYAGIAMITPIALVLAKGWMGSHLEKRHT